MKSTIVSAVLLTLLSTAGCAKSTDLGKMQEETIATVKIYVGELETLQRRYDALVAARGPSQDANAMLEAAGQAINTARTRAASAPTVVAAAAKSGNAEALTQEHYAIITELEKNIALAKDDLAGYEAFAAGVAYASSRPVAIPPTTPPPNTPVGNDGAGSAAPTTPGRELPCSAEIALQCPDGQIDACIKDPTAATHVCVPL